MVINNEAEYSLALAEMEKLLDEQRFTSPRLRELTNAVQAYDSTYYRMPSDGGNCGDGTDNCN